MLLMLIEVNNKGIVNFCKNWLVAGRTRQIKVKQYFLCVLKEAGLLKVKGKSSDLMTTDLFTKNLGRPLFEKYCSEFYGKDKYHIELLMKQATDETKKKVENNFLAFRVYHKYREFWLSMFDE